MSQWCEAGMSAHNDRSVLKCSGNCGGFGGPWDILSHIMVEAQVYDTCAQTCGKMKVC